jgi:hypothetical protein
LRKKASGTLVRGHRGEHFTEVVIAVKAGESDGKADMAFLDS